MCRRPLRPPLQRCGQQRALPQPPEGRQGRRQACPPGRRSDCCSSNSSNNSSSSRSRGSEGQSKRHPTPLQSPVLPVPPKPLGRLTQLQAEPVPRHRQPLILSKLAAARLWSRRRRLLPRLPRCLPQRSLRFPRQQQLRSMLHLQSLPLLPLPLVAILHSSQEAALPRLRASLLAPQPSLPLRRRLPPRQRAWAPAMPAPPQMRRPRRQRRHSRSRSTARAPSPAPPAGDRQTHLQPPQPRAAREAPPHFSDPALPLALAPAPPARA
jgi:hypothetical protein